MPDEKEQLRRYLTQQLAKAFEDISNRAHKLSYDIRYELSYGSSDLAVLWVSLFLTLELLPYYRDLFLDTAQAYHDLFHATPPGSPQFEPALIALLNTTSDTMVSLLKASMEEEQKHV